MRLKSIEIKGFKSFGDRVLIHFSEGVTSIVGPNGSGKSNVVDAMRWVLGEQKIKMLRSEKMENIIFNGTKNRKPANLAEVSLTFENTRNVLPTEFSNVTITRKYYRSGDSEYQLNGVTCRLRDITDLFLDTGIGSDSYSIIELKMIDDILNDRNDTITMLFEEAAGISKYKIRKKQTFARLEETEADLARVNDILFEIEKNMKTLESQARKAERYQKLREQYKELSIELALHNIVTYRDSFADVQKQIEKHSDEKLAMSNVLVQLEADQEKLKLQTLEKEKLLSDSQKELNNKISEITRYEHDKKLKDERLKHLLAKQQELNQSIEKNHAEVELLHDKIKTLVANKESEETVIKDEESLLALLKTQLTEKSTLQAELRTKLETASATAREFQFQLHSSEKDHAVREAQKETLEKEIDILGTELKELSSELERLGTLHSETNQSKLSHEKKFGELAEALDKKKFNLLDLKAEFEKTNELLIAENRNIDSKQNEYNLTKSLIENLEGFPDSIKFLKKNDRNVADAPLLSDIIGCKQDYKLAIENYLEPFMNYFVMDDMSQAHQAINLLSKSSKGRGNFFILSEFENEQEPIIDDVENCIHALQIIDVDRKYDKLCRFLLRNVYIVQENQDNTPFLQFDKAKAHIYISQNGKYHRTRHAISGGSVGLFDGKRIGRAKNLESLSKEIKSLDISRTKLKTLLDEKQQIIIKTEKEIEQLRDTIEKHQTETSNFLNQLSGMDSKIDYIDTQLKSHKNRIDQKAGQLKELGVADVSSNQNHEALILRLNEELKSINAEVNEFNNQLSTVSIEVTGLNESYNQQNIKFLQQQNKINSIARESGYNQNMLDTIELSITNSNIELEKVIEQVAEIIQTAHGSDHDLTALYEQKTTLEKQLSDKETEFYTLRGAIDELEQSLRENRKKKENADIIGNSLQEKTTELKIQLSSLKERLSVEFEVNVEELEKEQPEREAISESDLDELKQKLEKIKNQIHNYGPINPMAVEAYNEIKERHDFITNQQEDLAKAKASLLETINEIDQTAKAKFNDAFSQIRENFINVFRSLFSEEDKCDLILSNPDDPLESEIQIVAQPKGKRPLSINQLSGGEKTLTATALLFGIYLLKPAPFCIFDEVDAPLDDHNIDKFNKIIKKFSGESQFIIVTHNKRTMASTDIIYGITMVEQGVTQVVPVDMRQFADQEMVLN